MFKYSGILIFLISACSAAPQGPTRTIEWQEWQDTNALRHFCDERVPGAARGQLTPISKNLIGCYREVGNVCVVHTSKDDTDTLGHETKHCFKGNFHNSF